MISAAAHSLLTVRDVAKRLNVTPACVYALVESGKLACHRIGVGRGAIRIREADLTAYLAETRVEGRAKPKTRPTSNRLRHIKV